MGREPPLRAALVGYGLGGSVFHAPLISVTPGLSLAAVVTSDPDRQAAVKQRYPGTAIVPRLDQLLARADSFDLAIVTVPNAAHVGVATAALQAGLDVVIDKPVAPTAAEAEGLSELAGRLDRLIFPFHNRRWDGDFRTAAALLADGRLGTVWRFESRFERWKPTGPDRASWKQDPDQAGGGILFDLGAHLVDQALVLFGLPQAVYAETATRRSPLDDDAFVALSYPRGLVAHLWANANAAQLGPRFRILGSAAGYVKEGLDGQEEALRAGRSPNEPGWGQESTTAWGRLGTVAGVEAVPTRPGRYQDFYAGVVAAMVDGADPPVRWRDAVEGLRIIEAAHRSAHSGSVVATD